MADFDDLKLDRPREEATPPPPRMPLWLPIGVAVLIAALAALWYFGGQEPEQPEAVPRAAAPPTPTAPTRLPGEPGEDIPLPPLGETDALVRDLVARLSSHPVVAAWLTTDHLIRNMTVVTLRIANGQTPSGQLGAVRPTGDFQVRQAGSAIVIDPGTYARYDTHAAAVDGLDARGVARFYATIKPRIDDAYRELGAPHGDFDTTLERAIVELLKTPIVEGEIRLKSDGVEYLYADPALESLSHAQRQFLRMGPENMRIVKAKLREVAEHLGIPDAALPPPDSAADEIP